MAGVLRAAAVLLFLFLTAMAGWFAATRWRPSTERYPLQGIDLAMAPGPIEWGSIRAAGADFAYLAATEGSRRREPSFESNWAALPDAGLRRGAVHLYSLCEPALAQANAFNVVVPRSDDALPPAVEVAFRDDCPDRPSAEKLAADLRLFAGLVETHAGKPPVLRLSRSVERAYGLSSILGWPVWAIGDFLAPGYPARPWRLWRATDMRRVEGSEEPVNWDVVAS